MHKNEYPWHKPATTIKQECRFRHLVEFHELALAWLDEMKIPQESYLMTRGQAANLSEDLWLLQSLRSSTLGELLDETHPDEVLRRLSHTVWVVQAYTLLNLLDRAKRDELMPLLAQASWKLGRKQGEARAGMLSKRDENTLTTLLACLSDSWFFGEQGPEGYLVVRNIASELHFELHGCAHHCTCLEVRPVADLLCQLHNHWLKGFVYALNNRVSIADIVAKPRCIQRWSFL